MSNFSDAIGGLQTVLQTDITELKVYDHPVDSVNEFPAGIIVPEAFDPRMTFSGNSFEGRLRLIVLLFRASTDEAYDSLYDYIDPTTAGKSIIKVVRDNKTLNSKVDDAQVVMIENIGRRTLWGGDYVGFDAVIEFIKTVA